MEDACGDHPLTQQFPPPNKKRHWISPVTLLFWLGCQGLVGRNLSRFVPEISRGGGASTYLDSCTNAQD